MFKQITLPGHGWTRRKLLAAFPTLSAVAVAGCTITENSDGTTTVVVNTSEVDSYTSAIVTASATILSIAAVSSAIGAPLVAEITTAATTLKTAVSAWDKASGGSETFTVNSTSWATVGKTVIADAQTLAADLAGVPAAIESSVSSSVYSTVNTVVLGAQSALSFLEALFSSFVSVTASVRRMGAGEPKLSRVQTFRAVGLGVPVWAPALDAADAGLPLGAPRSRLVRVTGGQVLFTGGAGR